MEMEKPLRRLGALCFLCACLLPQPADGATTAAGLAPPPTAGAEQPQPAPHFGFPLQPTLGSAAPPPVAVAGEEGYPFIGSNPTVPLPTGTTDTVLPLAPAQVAGLAVSVPCAAQVSTMISITVTFALVFPLSTTCYCY